MEFPGQIGQSKFPASHDEAGRGKFDVREHLLPRRLTMLMWDQAFLLRHHKGGSFEDWDRVLKQTSERGYNTVRLDPMPQWIDLSEPDQMQQWLDPQLPFLPWDWNCDVAAPAGRWLIEFMEKLLATSDLHYTLSAWWSVNNGPKLRARPETHVQAAEVWCEFLTQWEKRFGFERLVYVDLHNEVPFFMHGFRDKFTKETGHDWDAFPAFSEAQRQFLAQDLNGAMKILHRAWPQLRFTASIHGDTRWLDVPLEFDCLDVHFYSDADLRWRERTKMHDHFAHLTKSDHWFKDFSDRCNAAQKAMSPMFRQRQRGKLAAFASWAERYGMPLTTSESWSSWFYFDHPDMDWTWLLEWSENSVEDAIDYSMWGWTPHNYGQPQFKNWNDVAWHRRLTDRFLNS